MHFNPSRLEARAALNGDRKLEARQIGLLPTTDDDDPFGWLTSLFGGGDDDPTTTTTARGGTTITLGPVLTPVPLNTLTNTRTTRTTTRTTTPQSTPTVIVVTATPTPQPEPSPLFTTVTSTSSADQANTDPSQANVNSSTSNGLPGVVVGIIVAASVIFGLIFISLVARKVFQTRRRNRRSTWATTGVTPFSVPVTEKALPPPPPTEGREYPSTNYPAYPPPAAVGTTYTTKPYSPTGPSSANYPASYPFGAGSAPLLMQTNTTNAAPFTAADLAGPVVIQQVPPTPNAAAPALSVVKRTFVPSLPDELSISNGEQVRILSVYDDGWALCERVSNGEKGVVPQECLEMVKQPSTGALAPPGSEDSRLDRKSSLRRDQDQAQ